MALGGSGVVNASRSLVYGPAGYGRYLLAGRRTGVGCAVGLGNPDSNRHNVFHVEVRLARIGPVGPTVDAHGVIAVRQDI